MNKYKWNLLHKDKISSHKQILKVLLKNRNINNQEKFINIPQPHEFIQQDKTFKQLIEKHVKPAVKLITKSISQKNPVIIHGDYDVDGQTATAILWRTIYYDLGYKNVYPYIPNRFDEGYGLSEKSLQTILLLLKEKGWDTKKDNPLLITVDCGIVSNKEVKLAKKLGFTIIISDHHKHEKKLPKAHEIIWTDKATGVGIAWMLSHVLLNHRPLQHQYLDLAALGTICDLQPLTGFNRSITKYGIEKINKTDIIGLQTLKNISGIKKAIDTYEIGWIIGPRLNATGRLTSAADSLRLLSTNSQHQAQQLAQELDNLNKQRQNQTQSSYQLAIESFSKINADNLPAILITSHHNYHDGIIGLIAGKLTQTYYRPAIAISTEPDKKIAKGSARSIKGISIIDTLRKFNHLFEDLGGHDMAAGFSIKVENIEKLETNLHKYGKKINKSLFNKKLTIDLELIPDLITLQTLDQINQLKPFGIGNYEPIFMTQELKIHNFNTFGIENKHLKLFLEDTTGKKYRAIGFGIGEKAEILAVNKNINLAYQLSINTWNEGNFLELRIKDIKKLINQETQKL